MTSLENQILIVNFTHPNKNDRSLLIREIEDQNLDIWDIVVDKFTPEQATFFDEPDLADNNLYIFQCWGTVENAKKLEQNITQGLGKNYSFFLLKHLEAKFSNVFLDN